MALPEEDRAQLRDELDTSLAVEVDDELMAVLRKRQDDFARGLGGVPAAEMMARLRRR